MDPSAVACAACAAVIAFVAAVCAVAAAVAAVAIEVSWTLTHFPAAIVFAPIDAAR